MELMARLPLEEIGGAKVFRPCTIGGTLRRRGETLSADDLVGVKSANLRSLIDQRYIQAWRRTENSPIAEQVEGDVMIVPRAGTTNRFDVIVGKRLNGTAAMTKNEAEALAKRVQVSRAPPTAAVA